MDIIFVPEKKKTTKKRNVVRMNDGAAVLLSGYTTEIPPPRGVLGFRSLEMVSYVLSSVVICITAQSELSQTS